MPAFTYTPYDGSAPSFTMGMKPCDPENWIEPDEHVAEQLALKDQLLNEKGDVVFRAMETTRSAQEEVLQVLLGHLPQYNADMIKADGDRITVLPTGSVFQLSDFAEAPLKLAARLVQDDLLLISPKDGKHILSAAALCFPSSWSLAEKFGKPMEAVHAPVPGYQENLAQKVNFMMDRLPSDKIIWRMNWSLDMSSSLFRPKGPDHTKWQDDTDPLEKLYVRVERQTIRRLPTNGDILFTVRIYLDKLSTLQHNAHAAEYAQGMIDGLNAMNEAELAYKHMTNHKGQVIEALKAVL